MKPADKTVTQAGPHGRPDRNVSRPIPPVPDVSRDNSDEASVAYSAYRTGLSNHRTGLSEHRTDLSEYRTDLSSERSEMSMRRTGMSFQRTRMSADRTLMSIMRTALSLISFGFTIFQVFSRLIHETDLQLASNAPRNFGVAMVALGIFALTLGIIYHLNFMKALRQERKQMVQQGLVHGDSPYPISATLITAGLLWLLGLFAIVSMVFDVAPFA